MGTQRIGTGICVRERNVAVGAHKVRRIFEVARCRGFLAPSEDLESEPERFARVGKVNSALRRGDAPAKLSMREA
jgi:hypothetical protein